jgi:hypothetical protein
LRLPSPLALLVAGRRLVLERLVRRLFELLERLALDFDALAGRFVLVRALFDARGGRLVLRPELFEALAGRLPLPPELPLLPDDVEADAAIGLSSLDQWVPASLEWEAPPLEPLLPFGERTSLDDFDRPFAPWSESRSFRRAATRQRTAKFR